MKSRIFQTIMLAIFGLILSGTTVLGFILAKKTPDTVYISTEDELFSISEKLDGYYSLACDISITRPWKPIGTKEKPFTGTIVGNYKTIVFSQASLDFYDNEDELFWGFIGYNEGTILRTNFYGIEMKDEYDSPVNFGAFAVNNYGKITSCTLKNCNIRFSAPRVNFGAFVCNNFGDIRNCHLKTNFIIDVNSGDTIVGGLCSSMNSGIIEYCSVSQTSHLMINTSNEANNVFLGNAVGLLNGGRISNSYLTSASTSVRGKHNVSLIGTIGGCCSGESSVQINSLYLELRSYISALDGKKTVANGMLGKAPEKSNIFIENLLVDISANFTVENECDSQSYVAFENIIDAKNSYYLNYSTNAKYKNTDCATHIEKSNLSLNLLHWDEAVWEIKNEEIVFLKEM